MPDCDLLTITELIINSTWSDCGAERIGDSSTLVTAFGSSETVQIIVDGVRGAQLVLQNVAIERTTLPPFSVNSSTLSVLTTGNSSISGGDVAISCTEASNITFSNVAGSLLTLTADAVGIGAVGPEDVCESLRFVNGTYSITAEGPAIGAANGRNSEIALDSGTFNLVGDICFGSRNRAVGLVSLAVRDSTVTFDFNTTYPDGITFSADDVSISDSNLYGITTATRFIDRELEDGYHPLFWPSVYGG
jgi:hypothetical protein